MRLVQKRVRSSGFSLTELLVVMAIVGAVASLLLPAIQQARESARRTACQNHLRQLALALHSFEAARTVFPASGWTTSSTHNPAGKFIGWRAIILPYLEQTALESAYDRDQHWWEGRNLVLGCERLPVFLCPSVGERSTLTAIVAKSPRPALQVPEPLGAADYEALMGVQAVVNADLYATPQANRSVLYRNSATRMAEISDGTSQTIMVTECVARPLVFRGRTRRPELSNDQGQGWIDSESAFSLDGATADGAFTGLGPSLTSRPLNATNENEPYSFHAGGAFCLFADGHVTFLAESISLPQFAALATRAGGEQESN